MRDSRVTIKQIPAQRYKLLSSLGLIGSNHSSMDIQKSEHLPTVRISGNRCGERTGIQVEDLWEGR